MLVVYAIELENITPHCGLYERSYVFFYKCESKNISLVLTEQFQHSSSSFGVVNVTMQHKTWVVFYRHAFYNVDDSLHVYDI